MAASLLEAARARRRKVSIRLYGARPFWGPDRPLVLDDPSLAELASLGIPIPGGRRLEGIRTLHGDEEAVRPTHLSALPRNRLVVLLRSLLHAQGVELVDQLVGEIAPTRQGSWVVRAGGASHPVDAVVLACGAGAPLATTIRGHRPPPARSACLLRLSGRPAEPWLLRIPRRAGGEIAVVPQQDGAWISLCADGANTQALAEALLERAARGDAYASGTPSELSSHWVPDGAGVPGVPTLGSALGGPIEGLALSVVGRQAAELAAALLDGGMERGLETSRQEGRAVARALARARRGARLPTSFSEEARAWALGRERARRGPVAQGPVHRVLSGAAGVNLGDLVLAWLLLVVATVASWVGRKPARRIPAPGRSVYIVEDDATQAAGLAAFLESRGFSCVVFPDALQAAILAVREPPAALILDLALPWIDGVEAIRALESAGLGKIPILITSGLTHVGELARSRLGAAAWFSKPVDLEELVRRLSSHAPPDVPGVTPLAHVPEGDGGNVGRL